MKNINIDELNVKNEVSAEEAAAVKGGPAYMKLGDIKGEATRSSDQPTESLSLNFEEIKF
ncbi:MAG: hypothetical protein KF886_21045 [Candidatus Hydrogenedentes bacterium]|nr:hypothetical protein [Candidatus Hydrogenedentota bacterium]